MKIDVLTIFPEFFEPMKTWSIIGRAIADQKLNLELTNIRDFSIDKHRKVDDYPFGGGHGMVMMAQPIVDAIEHVSNEQSHIIYLSPKGKPLDQRKLNELATREHIVLLCGHYEGIDQRVVDYWVDEEISIGDYVLTGGEIPAMVLIDGVTRLLPEVLSSESAYSEESHYHGRLEYPQYTRPRDFRGHSVPEVLLSGHHKKIDSYLKKESLKETWLKRPDMLKQLSLSDEEKKILDKIIEEM